MHSSLHLWIEIFDEGLLPRSTSPLAQAHIHHRHDIALFGMFGSMSSGKSGAEWLTCAARKKAYLGSLSVAFSIFIWISCDVQRNLKLWKAA